MQKGETRTNRDLIGFEGEWSSRNGEEGRESTSVETKRQVPESRPVFPQPSEQKRELHQESFLWAGDWGRAKLSPHPPLARVVD